MKGLSIDPRVDHLVKAGKLRVGLGVGSPALSIKDPATGELHGPVLDLARALAARIGVELQLVENNRPDTMLEQADKNIWDVTFIMINPGRMGLAEFSPSYIQSDWTYLVMAGSVIQSVADVDQPGVRIAMTRPTAGTRHQYEVKLAECVFAENMPAGLELVRTGRTDAQAGPRTVLLAEAARVPDVRVLEDRVGIMSYAAAVPKGQTGFLAYVSEFLEEAKASGLLKRTVVAAGLQGVQVSPAANLGSRQ